MGDIILLKLTSIPVLGTCSQWLAAKLKLPSILILLIVGIIVGPITGWLNPSKLFGNILLPLISVSVAVIMFEGGLSLKFSELKGVGNVLFRLLTIGVLTTWILTTWATHAIGGVDLQLSFLIGAILVVTGPTVIGPLLQQVRPEGDVASLLKWEGIVIDPIGAVLSLIVFQGVFEGNGHHPASFLIIAILRTLVSGSVVGLASGYVLILILYKRWLPDYLQNPASLSLVALEFVVADLFQPEAGLLAVTVTGILLANQEWVGVKHIIEFKESLRTLLIAALFIVLAGRLKLHELLTNLPYRLMLIGFLIIVVRPISVLISKVRSKLPLKERIYLSFIAPRGIVAASVSSIFALRMAAIGADKTEQIVPVTFLVIIVTVLFYGLIADPLARLLDLAHNDPQGVLFLGAHSLSRQLAKYLMKENIAVLVIDSNRSRVLETRMDGIPSLALDIFSRSSREELDLTGIGTLLAVTPNNEVNALAALQFTDVFGSDRVFQLPVEITNHKQSADLPQTLRGDYLFSSESTYNNLMNKISSGSVVKGTPLTKEFGYNEYIKQYGNSALPLLLIKEDRKIQFFSPQLTVTPRPGQTIVSLVEEKAKVLVQ